MRDLVTLRVQQVRGVMTMRLQHTFTYHNDNDHVLWEDHARSSSIIIIMVLVLRAVRSGPGVTRRAAAIVPRFPRKP